mgnify:FL=1
MAWANLLKGTGKKGRAGEGEIIEARNEWPEKNVCPRNPNGRKNVRPRNPVTGNVRPETLSLSLSFSLFFFW